MDWEDQTNVETTLNRLAKWRMLLAGWQNVSPQYARAMTAAISAVDGLRVR